MNLIIFLPQALESVHKLYEYKAFDLNSILPRPAKSLIVLPEALYHFIF